jgi:hypothetical protein
MHDFTCVVCGEPFKARMRTTRKQQYCSKSCIWKGTKGSEFNARIARGSALARGSRTRGSGTRGYVKVGGRHEHRIVAEKMLGRPLRSGEVVHHIDENKHNNAPENLSVISRAQHMQEHGLGIKGMKLPWKPWEHRKTKS